MKLTCRLIVLLSFLSLPYLLVGATNQALATPCLEREKVERANYQLASRFSKKKVNKLLGSTTVTPYWFEKSDKFWYIYETFEGRKYYIVDPKRGSKREIFDNGKMAARLSQLVKTPYDAANLPLERFLLQGDTLFTFTITTPIPGVGVKVQGFEYDFERDILREIEGYERPNYYPVWGSVSPDNRYAVFSKEFNLYLLSWEDYEKATIDLSDTTINAIQLTFDGEANFSYGPNLSNSYTLERDRKMEKRPEIVWSPDSKKFALIRVDEREVNDLWVINSLATPRPTLEMYKYSMPGEKEVPQKRLSLYDLEKREMKEIPISRFKDEEVVLHKVPRHSKTQFDPIKYDLWDGSASKFYITVTSRDHKRIDFCEVSTESGEVRCLIEERMGSPIEGRDPIILEENIFWWSRRDGWAHLYNYDKSGELIGQITEGEFHVEEIVAVDSLKKRILFTANGVDPTINPYYSHLYITDFNGERVKNITPGNFDNETSVSPSGKYLVNNYSRVDTAPVADLLDVEGNKVIRLEESDLSRLFAAGYKFPEPFTVKAADGKSDLYGVMYKPYDFDSTKCYPIIEHVYPGPQTEEVNSSWHKISDQTDRLAQLGFIVISIGNRGGSPTRSLAYHNFGYGNLRDYALEDKKCAVEQLAQLHPYIDIERVGIHGFSAGGLLTATALFKYPQFYKVGISISGNHDSKIYNRWWGERYQGVGERVSASGDTTFHFNIDTSIELAKNLKGKLLLISGDQDSNVNPAHTLRLVNSLIKANKRFDMFIFPGERHSFSHVSDYLFWLMGDYFSKHLMGDWESSADIIYLNNDL